MKISQLTRAAVKSDDMLIPVELYGQTMSIGMGDLAGMDGTDGRDAITVQVTSDKGSVILNGEGERTLTATVLCGTEDITALFAPTDFCWRRTSHNPADDAVWNSLHKGVGNVIKIYATEILRNARFDCDVMIEE